MDVSSSGLFNSFDVHLCKNLDIRDNFVQESISTSIAAIIHASNSMELRCVDQSLFHLFSTIVTGVYSPLADKREPE